MSYTFTIEPGSYHTFDSEEELIEQCKEWGLLSEKAVKAKDFYYKGNGVNLPCSIVGYEDAITAVIAFENKQKHCIHPSFLKEMQASNYVSRVSGAAGDAAEETADEQPEAAEADAPADEPVKPKAKPAATGAGGGTSKAPKKEKTPKLQLPEEKVKMTATVKEFTTVPNNFSETDDEVIIYEAVSILEPETEVGLAWSSHSNTLKKLELEVGDTITFECKIVAKKLTKHPVAYKINNPAKITKS